MWQPRGRDGWRSPASYDDYDANGEYIEPGQPYVPSYPTHNATGKYRRRDADIDILDNPTKTISQDHTGEGRKEDGELLALRAQNGHPGPGLSRSPAGMSQHGYPPAAYRRRGDSRASSDASADEPKGAQPSVRTAERYPWPEDLPDDASTYSAYTRPPPAWQDNFISPPPIPLTAPPTIPPPTRNGTLPRRGTGERSIARANTAAQQDASSLNPDETEIDSRIKDLKSQIKILERNRKLGPDPWQKQIICRVFGPDRKKNRPQYYDPYSDPAPEFDAYGNPRMPGQKKQVDHFLDPPRWTGEQAGYGRLEGTLPVSSVESYIERFPRLAFVIFRDYDGTNSDSEGFDSTSQTTQDGNATPFAESLCIVREDLLLTLRNFLLSLSGTSDFYQKVAGQEEFQAPYLFVYHHQKELAEFEEKHVPETVFEQWSLLMNDYIRKGFSAEYDAANEAFARGVVTHRLVKFLIKPGDVLLSFDESHPRAYQALSWATAPKHPSIRKEQRRQKDGLNRYRPGGDKSDSEDDLLLDGNILSGLISPPVWKVQVGYWDFRSTFKRKSYRAKILLEAKVGTEVPIAKLRYYPIQYGSEKLTQELRRRGEIFWQCRTRKYVECKEDSIFHSGLITTRYMIDPKTYVRLHGRDDRLEDKGDLPESAFESDTPPEDPFILLLPPTMKGFKMHDKKWVDLDVARVSDVTWNTQAFKSLVADTETKDLIEALVRNKLETQQATDLIDGKGNGLIILLHGGPGTGKTFTAESVAEIAQKPLYRVTCGDIGITPRRVEEYLESVLYLGRLWGCVVLLDEADVFLEERTLTDLARNALVSVFLRVLEYYSGILILTSNRVGIFDEAFKSRIQLTLRYETLTRHQRHQIWQNFVDHIQTFDEKETIDFLDINSHISDLSTHEMNGREIRNCITTGRQLARFRKTKLNFKLLRGVIDVAGRFDKYLEEVKQAEALGPGGTFADNVAREAGNR